MIIHKGRILGQFGKLGCRSDCAAVESGGGNGTRVHQCDIGDLTVSGLGAFPVGEVSGGMADGESTVGRDIACAEAWAAESAADRSAGGNQLFQSAGTEQLHHDGLTCRIAGEPEVIASERFAV